MARSTALALLLTAPVMAPAAAQPADTVEKVEALAREARTLYDAGEFGQAVAVYLEAYKLQPTAAVLYNVAVIYDKKLQEVDLAIDFYRRYIGSPDADPPAVQRATVRIQELKTEQAARREADLARLPTRPPPTATPEDTVLQPVEVDRPLSGQTVWGYVALGSGVALAAGGAVMGVLASDAADEFAGSTDLDDKLDHRDTAESRALVADVLIGVGAAAAVAGLLMIVLDDGDPAARGASIGLAPTAGGVGIWWGGSL
ncbi:MAG: hypothetical protein R3F65_10980 [bacterium]|nr:hypothetical protein [Myxococcales bacterium]MCB9551694.1 hypothetical protein [Myxococcales bacterium]